MYDSDWLRLPFSPLKPSPTRDNPNCAVWDGNSCQVEWNASTIEGHLVESLVEAMSPVFDYRWESFHETVNWEFVRTRFDHVQNSRWISSTSIVISVHSSRPLLIFLCGKMDGSGPCFVISIGKLLREFSISICANITWNLPKKSILCHFGGDRTELDGFRENEDNDKFETEVWRTFRIHGSSTKKTIRIFEGDEKKPLLSEHFKTWYKTGYMSLVLGGESRARVHDYQYILLKSENTVLSTSNFTSISEYFCIELFVGLCPDCRLDVVLVSDEKTIEIGSIDGNMNSTINKLLAWRSVKLNVSIAHPSSKDVRLELWTRLKNPNIEGRWAIDSLRRCEPAGKFGIVEKFMNILNCVQRICDQEV
ncbi:uncharacterized protein LOC125500929 [Athalia rosae]|uniref:uncharacterized protein LOC125500929 n=1 Tax=Athalia rosae TaxID=37344 RepID=UPI002033E9C1|nr:uncharacterized protein LOC125500929 [Athalia rosae]